MFPAKGKSIKTGHESTENTSVFVILKYWRWYPVLLIQYIIVIETIKKQIDFLLVKEYEILITDQNFSHRNLHLWGIGENLQH